ncbi:hypothetical protein [Mycobacterium sp. OTB74]|nr:hypothetical protein [Mycobacterium sp. OTB74]
MASAEADEADVFGVLLLDVVAVTAALLDAVGLEAEVPASLRLVS